MQLMINFERILKLMEESCSFCVYEILFITQGIFSIIFLPKIKQQFENFIGMGTCFFPLRSVFMSISTEVAFEILGY